MLGELGISFGTALIILISMYYIIKWAVKNAIEESSSKISKAVKNAIEESSSEISIAVKNGIERYHEENTSSTP